MSDVGKRQSPDEVSSVDGESVVAAPHEELAGTEPVRMPGDFGGATRTPFAAGDSGGGSIAHAAERLGSSASGVRSKPHDAADVRSPSGAGALVWQLAGFFGLAMAGLVAISFVVLSESRRTVQSARHVDELARLADRLGAVVHETQRERGLSLLHLVSPRNEFADDLADQRRQADQQVAVLRQYLDSSSASNQLRGVLHDAAKTDANPHRDQTGSVFGDGRNFGLLRAVISQLEQIEGHRAAITSKSIETDDALAWFTQLHEKCLATIEAAAHASASGRQVMAVNALVSLINAKEFAGLERAALSNAFAADHFEEGLYDEVRRLDELQRSHLKRFLSASPPQHKQFYHDVMSASSIRHVKRLRKLARERSNEGDFGVDPVDWFDFATARIDLLRQVENHLVAELREQSNRISAAAQLRFTAISGLSLLMLGTVAIGGWWCLRSYQKMGRQQKQREAALQAAQDMQRSVTETAVDGIITINTRRQILFFNRAAEELFGYSAEEVLGRNINIVVPAPWKSQHDRYVQQYLEGKPAGVMGSGRHVKGLRKDGSVFPLFLSLGTFSIGGEQYFTGIVRDTTEEERVKQDLKDTVAEMEQQAWSKTHSGQILNGLQGVATVQECAQLVISGLAPLLGAGYAAFYALDQREGHGTDARRSLALLGTYGMEERRHAKNSIEFGEGLVGQCALEQTPIRLTDVPADYVRVQSGVGQSAPLNIYVVPILHEQEVMGVMEFAVFKPLDDRQQDLLNTLVGSLGVILDSNSRRQITEELLDRSEKLREELKRRQDEISSANESLLKQTESLEQQKRHIETKNQQIEDAMTRVQQQAEEIEQASKYKSEFLANMSHELRTPLNSLLILSKSLMDNREGNLTDEQVESSRVIYDGGQDLLRLINDILDLSKVEAGMLQVQWEPVRLADTVRSIERQLEHLAANKHIEFTCRISDALPNEVITDGLRLEQILKNLLSNAIKFTEAGSVTLELEEVPSDTVLRRQGLRPGNTIALSVIDTGIGIPEDKQQAIFHAFQQADGSTTRCYGGTGLGLTISRQLAHLLGGEIHVHSVPGEGSTFTLFIPKQKPAAADPANTGASSPAVGNGFDDATQRLKPSLQTVQAARRESKGAGQPAPVEEAGDHERPPVPVQADRNSNDHSGLPDADQSGIVTDDRRGIRPGDKTVLLIEDDEVLVKVLLKQIRQRGYKCLVAGDGVTGLQLADEYSPSCILLDLMIPFIDGFDFLRLLKDDLATRHIPVCTISAHDPDTMPQKLGAINHIAKPIAPEDLDRIFEQFEHVLSATTNTLLVVEDNDDTQVAIATLLKSDNLEIVQAMSAEEACELVADRRFDCIVCDLKLPGISGIELIGRLQQYENFQTTPVIVYTGRGLQGDDCTILNRYAVRVVMKASGAPAMLLDAVSLFLHRGDKSLEESQREAIRSLHGPNETLQGRNVLVVDDDVRNAFAMSKTLGDAGLNVTIADNGELGLEKLNSDPSIDIVLMDIMMPVLNGYDAISRIREQDRFQTLPIIALTAKGMSEDRDKAIAVGANDYLTKPVDIDRLLAMMKMWLHSANTGLIGGDVPQLTPVSCFDSAPGHALSPTSVS